MLAALMAATTACALTVRTLGLADAPSVERLAALQSWDQPLADVELLFRLIEADPSGTSAALGHFADDELVSCAALLRIDAQTCWLSYVITAEGWRRRGLARAVCTQLAARAKGDTVGLFGAVGGQHLYHTLGFEPCSAVTLMSWPTGALAEPSPAASPARALAPHELEAMLRAETPERAVAMREWYSASPELACAVPRRDGAGLLVCALGRPWNNGNVFIGPVLAGGLEWQDAEGHAAVHNVLIGAMAAAGRGRATSAVVLLGRGGDVERVVRGLGFSDLVQGGMLMIRPPRAAARTDRSAHEESSDRQPVQGSGVLAGNALPALEVLAAGYELG